MIGGQNEQGAQACGTLAIMGTLPDGQQVQVYRALTCGSAVPPPPTLPPCIRSLTNGTPDTRVLGDIGPGGCLGPWTGPGLPPGPPPGFAEVWIFNSSGAVAQVTITPTGPLPVGPFVVPPGAWFPAPCLGVFDCPVTVSW